MCQEKERVQESGERAGDAGTGRLGRCAPMMKTMLGTFRDAVGGPPENAPTEAAEASEAPARTAAPKSGLEPRDRELVALGAALGSNCVPCVEHHVPEARKAGLSDAEIRDAIRLADRIRKVPARKVLETALGLVPDEPTGSRPASDGQAPSPDAMGVADGACCG